MPGYDNLQARIIYKYRVITIPEIEPVAPFNPLNTELNPICQYYK